MKRSSRRRYEVGYKENGGQSEWKEIPLTVLALRFRERFESVENVIILLNSGKIVDSTHAQYRMEQGESK